MNLTSITIVRREARLAREEFVEFKAAPRTTIVVTRAKLDTILGDNSWTFNAFGYRKERDPAWNLGDAVDRELTYSSRSGPDVPVELSDLFRQMMYGKTKPAPRPLSPDSDPYARGA